MSEARRHLRVQLIVFFGAVLFTMAAVGIHQSIFNNFLVDTFRLSPESRGWLEFPRELPGLLAVLMAGLLATLPVTRTAVVGALIFCAGMVGLAVFGGRYWLMVLTMMVASAGMHLLQPVLGSVAMSFSHESKRGRRLGQMGAIGTVGMILGTGFVWLTFDRVSPAYWIGFLAAAAAALVAGAIYAGLHIPHLQRPRSRLVFRRKYRLYYLLEFVFGARKQIFLTFGPWVLIQVYGASAANIAALMMTGSVIGIGFRPLTGWAIDRLGERNVMIADGLLLAVVCIGYGYASSLTGNMDQARMIACGCFITDRLLFALGTGRSVYMSRLATSPEEMTSTLAMGVSINHIASMTIPAAAGAVWIGFGYEWVFAAAAILAVGISILSSFVPRKGALTQPPA